MTDSDGHFVQHTTGHSIPQTWYFKIPYKVFFLNQTIPVWPVFDDPTPCSITSPQKVLHATAPNIISITSSLPLNI